MSTAIAEKKTGRFVAILFVGFFAVVIAVNAVFITLALSTHSGVVTENAYQKGIRFNETLSEAKAQPAIIQKTSFVDGRLRWDLTPADQKPLESALVKARLFRPVQDGYDFDITLEHKGNGIYEATPDFPLKGHWKAQLKATWNTHETYQKIISLTVK